MQVVYEKGARARIVPGVGRVERGQAVTVNAEQGKRLVAQGWQEVKATPKPKPAVEKPVATTKTEEE